MSVNLEVKQAIEQANVKKWQVASCLGVADTTFSRWLRAEMAENKKVLVLAAIDRAKEKFKGE